MKNGIASGPIQTRLTTVVSALMVRCLLRSIVSERPVLAFVSEPARPGMIGLPTRGRSGKRSMPTALVAPR